MWSDDKNLELHIVGEASAVADLEKKAYDILKTVAGSIDDALLMKVQGKKEYFKRLSNKQASCDH